MLLMRLSRSVVRLLLLVVFVVNINVHVLHVDYFDAVIRSSRTLGTASVGFNITNDSQSMTCTPFIKSHPPLKPMNPFRYYVHHAFDDPLPDNKVLHAGLPISWRNLILQNDV